MAVAHVPRAASPCLAALYQLGRHEVKRKHATGSSSPLLFRDSKQVLEGRHPLLDFPPSILPQCLHAERQRLLPNHIGVGLLQDETLNLLADHQELIDAAATMVSCKVTGGAPFPAEHLE